MKYKRILKKIYKSQKRSFAFCFILHFWIELWMWLHRWVPALGLVLGQYANNNILFPSMWLPLAQSTHWNLNQSWELWWVSKDWIKWDWYWVNKCSVKVYLLVYMCMCLCVRVLQGAHSACVREHMCVCAGWIRVCYFPCPWGKLGPFWRALRTAKGEKPHTFTQAIQSVCLSNTAPNGHLWVCIRCPNK